MIVAVISICIGLLLLIAGGEGTVRGSSSLATRLKVPPFIIGATIVAFGTSAPELVVTLTAALKGSPGLAFGNVIGSNIANLGLILGLAALTRPIKIAGPTIKPESPVILAVMVLTVLFCFNNVVSRIEGIILLTCLCAVMLLTLKRIGQKDQNQEESFEAQFSTPVSLIISVLGIGALIYGGQLLVNGAIFVSRAMGVSEYLIGVLALAVGTSLPEVAASVSAALHGRGDLAIGNVFGSNTFNVFFVLGTGSTISTMEVAQSIKPDLGFYILLTILPFSILFFRQRIGRMIGILLLCIYTAYVITVIGAS